MSQQFLLLSRPGETPVFVGVKKDMIIEAVMHEQFTGCTDCGIEVAASPSVRGSVVNDAPPKTGDWRTAEKDAEEIAMRKLTSERGMSLVEVTIILMVLALLTGVLAPQIMTYVDDARLVKAKEDVEAIGVGIARLLKDTGNPFLLEDGDATIASRFVTNNRVDLLVSDGMEAPVLSGVDNSVATNLQATLTWGDDIAAPAASAATGGVQSVYDHLVSNDATYVLPTVSLDTVDPPAPASLGRFGMGWRGAYLSGVVGPDPWSYRYACNTAFLGVARDALNAGNGANATGWSTDAFCFSAGQNNTIETDIESANGGITFSGTGPANDDIIYVISGFGK